MEWIDLWSEMDTCQMLFTTENGIVADLTGNNFSPEQMRIEMHQSQPTIFRYKWWSITRRPHRLMKTSCKQLKPKHRGLHFKWLHLETNSDTLCYYCNHHNEYQQPFNWQFHFPWVFEANESYWNFPLNFLLTRISAILGRTEILYLYATNYFN